MSRRTMIYLVVFAVLAVLSGAKRLGPSGPAPIAFRVAAVEASGVQKIVLTQSGEAVTFERDGSGFKLTSPLVWPADQDAVDALLRAFESDIPMDFLVSERPEDQAAYELTEAQALKIELYTDPQQPAVALYAGKGGPMGTSFLRPVGSAEIYRAKLGTVSRFKKSAQEWRDKTVMKLDEAEIVKLRVVDGEGYEALSLVQTGGQWASAGPERYPLAQTQVSSVVRVFSSLRASEIVEGTPEGAGMGTPELIATATLANGQTRAWLVGGLKDETSRWVGRSADAQLFVVRDSMLAPLRRTIGELRDMTLMSFNSSEVTRLTVADGDRRVVIEAGEGEDDWRLVEGQLGEVSPQTLRGLLSSLGSLRASSFHEDRSASSAGITEAGLSAELELQSGARHVLKLGQAADAGALFAQVDDGPVVAVRSHVEQNLRRLLPVL